ncbi:MAG TPA: site-specific DNA-methyltransferase [Candidatus Babeliaceae bacterium]|nr:site-specific DNA-methyltransferase [Candidatus Babeliaceae bacterium]
MSLSLAPFLNKVIEGDCLEVMKEFPDCSIDLILCDLPYGTTINPWDITIDFDLLWQHYKRIVKPNGVVALTSAGIFTGKVILSNPTWFKYKIVWIKSKSTNFLNAKKQPLRRHEDICIFYNKQPIYHPQMIQGVPYSRGWRKTSTTGSYGLYKSSPILSSDGKRYPFDILFFNEDEPDDWFYCKTCEHEDAKPYHPTQKPVDLGRYLIRTFTRPGAIVLDNACGCGSFLIAAIREGRQFIGIEKNNGAYHQKVRPIDFVKIARERIAAEPPSQPLV